MHRRLILLIIILEISGIFVTSELYGFGSNYTHPTITILALDNVIRNGQMDRYLKEELDIQDGIIGKFTFHRNISEELPENEIERNNNVPGKTLRRGYPTRYGREYEGRYLIIAGSEAEDHPTERSQHHFLDPVSNKGLDNNYNGAGFFADFLALFYPPAEQSNVGRFICAAVSLCEPSFNLDGTSAIDRVEGRTSNIYPYNYFAWPDTREYFYNALTAETEEERDHYFALMFFSLGHNLHILEDMGVPAHTRNDFLYDHIWHGLIKGLYIEGYLESGRMVEKIADTEEIVSFNKVSDFWDNNGTSGLPGLAEYVNHNFFSEGTVFKKYEYPEQISIEAYNITAEDGQNDIVQYYTGRTSDGLSIPHLAAVGLLHSEFEPFGNQDRAKYTAYLDPYCYKDYSEIIIPRVVSYVSGLIEYFFRGKIAVIKERTGGLKIKNISTEPVSEGVFEVYYDSTSGTRNRLALYALSGETALLPGDVTGDIVINTPEDNVSPGRFIIVYKGRLGDEDYSVIGKVISSRVYFVSDRNGSSGVYSMDMDGNDLKVLMSNTDSEITYTHPVVSPDGEMMAFHSTMDSVDAIWIKDSRTGEITRLTDGVWPDWSPDGRRIVYCKNTTGDKRDIFIIDIETHEEIRLTNDLYTNLFPAWSPDGSMIAYTSVRESKSDIILRDLSGNKSQNLTETIDNLDRWKPAWSPDGRKIAFEKPTKIVYSPGEPLFVNIHTLDLDTGLETNLTNIDHGNKEFGIWNGTPHWLNDKNIVIESNVTEEPWTDIWVIDSNGNGFIKSLTLTSGDDGYPFVW